MVFLSFLDLPETQLSNIWMAAHFQKKLKKKAYIKTSILKACKALHKNKKTLPLRHYGHYILGVTRIHHKQVEYLHQDCNEAFTKLRITFRKRDVDLDPSKEAAEGRDITLAEQQNGIGDHDDLMFMEFDLDDEDLAFSNILRENGSDHNDLLGSITEELLSNANDMQANEADINMDESQMYDASLTSPHRRRRSSYGTSSSGLHDLMMEEDDEEAMMLFEDTQNLDILFEEDDDDDNDALAVDENLANRTALEQEIHAMTDAEEEDEDEEKIIELEHIDDDMNASVEIGRGNTTDVSELHLMAADAMSDLVSVMSLKNNLMHHGDDDDDDDGSAVASLLRHDIGDDDKSVELLPLDLDEHRRILDGMHSDSHSLRPELHFGVDHNDVSAMNVEMPSAILLETDNISMATSVATAELHERRHPLHGGGDAELVSALDRDITPPPISASQNRIDEQLQQRRKQSKKTKRKKKKKLRFASDEVIEMKNTARFGRDPEKDYLIPTIDILHVWREFPLRLLTYDQLLSQPLSRHMFRKLPPKCARFYARTANGARAKDLPAYKQAQLENGNEAENEFGAAAVAVEVVDGGDAEEDDPLADVNAFADEDEIEQRRGDENADEMMMGDDHNISEIAVNQEDNGVLDFGQMLAKSAAAKSIDLVSVLDENELDDDDDDNQSILESIVDDQIPDRIGDDLIFVGDDPSAIMFEMDDNISLNEEADNEDIDIDLDIELENIAASVDPIDDNVQMQSSQNSNLPSVSAINMGDAADDEQPPQLSQSEQQQIQFSQMSQIKPREWSRRTKKAFRYLKQKPSKQLSFDALMRTAQKPETVASIFLELLVFKNYGLVDLQQEDAYGDIQITKTQLFQKHAFKSQIVSQSQRI